MAALVVKCRRFLHRHANAVDFLGASVLICLCFIILLPKVHESFQKSHPPTTEEPPHDHQHNHAHHHHHHHHQLPVGEVLVCAGFFVFYCIGVSFSGRGSGYKVSGREREPLLLPSTSDRKVSTVCCSSTRCPTEQRETASLKTFSVSPAKSKLSVDELVTETLLTDHNNHDDEEEEECVFTLNRHHNHHTHSRHHEHPVVSGVEYGPESTATSRARDYGSLASSKNELDRITPTKRCLVVEQITITTEPLEDDDDDHYQDDANAPDWPASLKIALFGLVFAGLLAVLDMNIQGVIEAFKVFKAAATGALLYVTFIILLPKGPAGCNACAKEEI